MRYVVAGFLAIVMPAVAWAQARGEVESIGFEGAYRPGCWTPMIVRLTPSSGSNFSGRIVVTQEDLDRDRVLFSQQVNFEGNVAGNAVERRFWVYFIPQPDNSLDVARTAKQLSESLKVRLCTESGKELVRLPITSNVTPIESLAPNVSSDRGRRLVLTVKAYSEPSFAEMTRPSGTPPEYRGLNEYVEARSARDVSRALPENAIGYEALDVVIWADADPTRLSADQVTALKQWIRRGGRLVILQDTDQANWQRNNTALADFMPVNVNGVEERDSSLLQGLALPPGKSPLSTGGAEISRSWGVIPPKLRTATATLKPGAFPVMYDEMLPYIVRMPMGAGCITWVAQDLGAASLVKSGSTKGWPYIWNKVIDWKDDPIPTAQNDSTRYGDHNVTEIGRSLLRRMELESTSAWLIGIAVMFFIGYWVLVGPVSYFFLAGRKKASLNWFAYAALSLAGTLATVGIVKLVLRGSPSARHYSIIRSVHGEGSTVRSGIGVYIPRDGMQDFVLRDTSPESGSFITPFNLHPAFAGDKKDTTGRQSYMVPVNTLQQDQKPIADPRSIQVPWRSTLKKFQAQWSGDLKMGLTVSEPLTLAAAEPLLKGKIANHTGVDLHAVYLVYHHPGIAGDPESGPFTYERDIVLYCSYWKAGAAITAESDFGENPSANKKILADTDAPLTSKDDPAKNVLRYKGWISVDHYQVQDPNVPSLRWTFFDTLDDRRLSEVQRNEIRKNERLFNWTHFWYRGFRHKGFGDSDTTDQDPRMLRLFPLLSLYGRLYPSANPPGQSVANSNRFDLSRRGLRHLDMSAAVSAGRLVVLASAGGEDQPLPLPLNIEGEKLTKASGVSYYQFVLPLDRSQVLPRPKPPQTRPTTVPATAPATQPKPQ